MCRFFAYTGLDNAHAAFHLIHDTYPLKQQSLKDQRGVKNADGWGVAYYEEDGGEPVVHKAPATAALDPEFAWRVEGIHSRLILAHVRNATVGEIAWENTHPFVFGNWAFAHNGYTKGFTESLLPPLKAELSPRYAEGIQGSTDSEYMFRLFLTERERQEERGAPYLESMAAALRYLPQQMQLWAGAAGVDWPPEVNVLLTDGQHLFALRWGHTLWIHPLRRPTDRSEGSLVWGEGELDIEADGGVFNHKAVVVASEPSNQSKGWIEVPQGHYVHVMPSMQFKIEPVIRPGSALAAIPRFRPRTPS